MENDSVAQLEKIIESRSQKERVIGGEEIAFFGIWLISLMSFQMLVYSAWWLWLSGIAMGWLVLFVYEYIRDRKRGKYSTKLQREINAIWIAIGLVISPLIVVVFPGYFKLYNHLAIYPLMYLFLGLAVWLSGVVAKHRIMKLSALVFLAGTFFTLFYTSGLQLFWIFNGVIFLGLVVPGVISKYYEKKR